MYSPLAPGMEINLSILTILTCAWICKRWYERKPGRSCGDISVAHICIAAWKLLDHLASPHVSFSLECSSIWILLFLLLAWADKVHLLSLLDKRQQWEEHSVTHETQVNKCYSAVVFSVLLSQTWVTVFTKILQLQPFSDLEFITLLASSMCSMRHYIYFPQHYRTIMDIDAMLVWYSTSSTARESSATDIKEDVCSLFSHRPHGW